MSKPQVLNCRCLSDNDFLNPIYGVAGTKIGSPTYTANGVLINANNEGWTNADTGGTVAFNPDRFTIQFDFTANWDLTSGATAGYNSAWTWFKSINKFGFSFYPAPYYFYFYYQGGDYRFNTGLTISTGTTFHVAWVYDIGGILGGANKMELYVDGVLKGNSTTAMPTETAGGNLSLGGYFNSATTTVENPDGYFKNFRVYDYCKQSFNDRFNVRGDLNDQVQTI